MKTIHPLLAVATLLVASTQAHAQACLGLPVGARNYIGAEQQESWTAYRRQTPVWGGRYAHDFRTDKGVSVITSIAGGAGGMKADTSAIYVSGAVAATRHMTEWNKNLSLCAAAGFEAKATDYPGESRNDSDGFGSVPLTLGFGYDLRMGALTLTPFAAPTLAYYQFESDRFNNSAKEHGWDSYVVMGATASFSRFSVGANYRNGDMSLGKSGRFGFNTGVSF
jgi:hypothetical protein